MKNLAFGAVLLLVVGGSVLYTLGEIDFVVPYFSSSQSGLEIPEQDLGYLLTTPYGVENDILELLATSKYQIYAWEYQITMREVITVLKNKASLGADVKIILENSTYGNNSKLRKDFLKKIADSPIEVKNDNQLGLKTNFVHAKTFVLDDKAIISTANLGYSGFWKNREYWFVVEEPKIVENIAELFKKDRASLPIRKRDIHPSLLFCPINCRQQLTQLISHAKKNIFVQAQYLEDPLTVQQLRKKQSEGVDVRIVVGKNQKRENLGGMQGVRMMKSPYNHAKNIMVDNEKLLIGSMNLSTNAIENNREISIITRNKKALGSFLYQFEKDWEKAEENSQ